MILCVPSRFEEAAMDAGLGYFGDERRERCGEFVARRMSERQTVCVRNLADDRAEQLRVRRFLANEAVTVEEMVSHRAMFVAAAAKGRHVLAIQDTSEVNYQAQKDRKRRLGKVGNGTDVGLFVHCVRDFREGGFPFWYIENTGINVTVSQFAWPHRAVKPQSRAAARRRRGA
jgi:hypothetical protein